MNQNGGIHKGGFAVLCHRNGGSESPGILIIFMTYLSHQDGEHTGKASRELAVNIPFTKCTLFADQVHPFR